MRLRIKYPLIMLFLFAVLGLFGQPTAAETYSPNTAAQALEQEPQTAPAQNWSVEKGKFKASGNLSSGGADGSAHFADNGESWAWKIGGRAGMLNEEFALGLGAAAGWSPGGDWGLWLNLDGEFTENYVDHYQATLNLGYRLSQDLRLLGTLDYLAKTVEVESWGKDEMLNQYGAGISVDYSFLKCLDLSGFFQHYKTEGQEYGKIREYEYVDANNWQHYGWLYGAVRGGDYDELGVDATYRLPTLGMDIGLGLSQIWRNYEEMLGYDSKSVESAAGRLSYGWRDIMASGFNFRAGISMEFATNDNLSWNLSLDKSVGPVNLSVNYSEYANDQTGSDRRLYACVSLPLGSAAGDAGDEDARDRGPAKPAFSGQWLTTPVTGMGQPTLKVSEQLERQVDETEVDLNELSDNTTISKDVMTVSGLPVLTAMDTTHSTPSSSFEAFSIGAGGTSVIIDLTKLPKPASIQTFFAQQDGLYSVISFSTEEGSTKVTGQGVVSNIPPGLLNSLNEFGGIFEPETALDLSIKGPTSTEEGATNSYSLDGAYIVRNGTDPFTGGQTTERVDFSYRVKSVTWEVSGNATLSSGSGNSVKVNATKEGSYTLTMHVILDNNLGDGGFTYHKSSVQVKVKAKPVVEEPDDGSDDDSGGGSGGDSGDATKLAKGYWYFTDYDAGGTFAVGLTIGSTGQATGVTSPDGPTSNVVSNINYNKGSVTGNVQCDIAGATHNYALNVTVSGTTVVTATSFIVHSVNAFMENVQVKGTYTK